MLKGVSLGIKMCQQTKYKAYAAKTLVNSAFFSLNCVICHTGFCYGLCDLEVAAAHRDSCQVHNIQTPFYNQAFYRD